MSTDRTPIDRAAEALLHPADPYRCNTPNPTIAPIIAREVVSAALHDPDDPDWLAQVLAEASGYSWKRHLSTSGRAFHRRMSATVRSAILGADQ